MKKNGEHISHSISSGDYKRPLLFRRPRTRRPICFPFFFLLFSPFFRHYHHGADLYLMVLSRVWTGGNLLQRFARGSIYQGPGRPRGQREINNSAPSVGIAADHFRSFPSALVSHPTRGRKSALAKDIV